MSEDAPVNTGAVLARAKTGSGQGTEDADQVAPLGGGDPARRFDDLYNLVYDPAFLVCAWERVRATLGRGRRGRSVTVAFIASRIGVECSWMTFASN